MANAQILVVEDESVVAKDIQNSLKSLGYAVPAVVSSGADAIKKVAETFPDLVLMDIRLQGEMDGVEAAEQIGSRFNIPVVYLTAYADEDTLQRAKITQPFGYIVKPFQKRELYSVIEVALYKSQMEKAVQESKERFHRVFESAPIGIAISDAEAKLLRTNESIQQIFGYNDEEMLGKSIADLTHPDDVEESLKSFTEIVEGKIHHFDTDRRYIRKDGKVIWCNLVVTSVRDSKGEFRYAFAMIDDITERKQMADALRESEERFRQFFENEPEYCYMTSPQGVLLDVNSAALKVLGYKKQELVGQPLNTIYAPESRPRIKQLFREWKITGIIRQEEMVIITKKGHKRTVLLNAGMVKDNDGKIIYSTSIQRDITQRKLAEEEIKAALKEKEMLLSEVHHRVKNNLQLIASLLNLQSEYIQDKKASEIFKASQERVRSLALIHEKLYQSEDLASIDFVEYTRDLTESMIESYGVSPGAVTMTLNIDDVLLEVDIAIPCALIINELVSNSLKHAFPVTRDTPAGMRHKIHISLYVSKDVSAPKGRTAEWFTLIVSDDGVGFPKELDFLDTESLGLQLVNTLTKEQLGGTIELDRSHGTEFKIRFRVLRPV